jgi:hypothetical protein
VIDTFNADASGELVIRVPEDVVDPLATIVAVEWAPVPSARKTTSGY